MTNPRDTELIPAALRAELLANGAEDADRVPVLKLFNPVGPGPG
jgi:hypothetical protein